MAFSKSSREKLVAKARALKISAPKYTLLAPFWTAAFKHSKSPTGESNSTIISPPFSFYTIYIISKHLFLSILPNYTIKCLKILGYIKLGQKKRKIVHFLLSDKIKYCIIF